VTISKLKISFLNERQSFLKTDRTKNTAARDDFQADEGKYEEYLNTFKIISILPRGKCKSNEN